MSGTQELRNEHRGIEQVLEVLEAICSGSGTDTENDLRWMVEFFRTFADRCHHTKEEVVLFPAVSGRDAEELVGLLHEEHIAAREHIQQMDAALNGGNREKFCETARAYTRLLRTHIRREDEELFPLADRSLPGDVQQGINRDYDRIEREEIGEGVHEEYHSRMEELISKYLK